MASRTAFWAVLLLAAVSFALRSNDVPLVDPDESRFARTSVEMLRSHDLVVPAFNGAPRLSKPPLLHWLQSFAFRTLGIHEWTARLHAIVATVVSAALVGWVARRRYGDEGAIWAAMVFVTVPLVFVVARLGTLDALLAVHVWAVVALDLAGPRDGPVDPRALAAGALAGLAFLVKGPIGALLPVVIVLAGRAAAGRTVLPAARSVVLASAAWSLVVLPWGLAFLRRVGSSRALETLRVEVLDRVFTGTVHSEPFWYYGAVALIGFLPWSPALLAALAGAWRERASASSASARYAAGGLVAGLVLFSLSQGKLPTYLVPLAPLVAILVSWQLGRELRNPQGHALVPTLLAATIAAIAAVAGLSALRFEGGARDTAIAGTVVFGSGAAVAIAGALRSRPRWVYGSAAATAWLFLLAAALLLWPDLGRTRSSAVLVSEVPALAEAGSVVTVELQVPSLSFYLDRTTETVPMSGLLARMDRPDRPAYVLADVDLPQVPPAAAERLMEVGRHGKLRVFIEGSDVSPGEGGAEGGPQSSSGPQADAR